ncbi:MAG: zinc-binding dehydrogenase [Betaproteobacteria bacterium]|nr:zinc-binding dehydrogenase [Betaproteobacteria bacterium]MDH3436972.1 zinc-binding dehydrogenase [Betaproteobacteria bacterium]
MKSFWIKTAGSKSMLELRDVAAPEPGPGQIGVRVRATALNRGELIAGSVMHSGAAKLGGTEAAGEVCTVGEGVTGWREGDRVMGRVLGPGRGAFAEHTVMQVNEAMPVPEHLSWEQAAAVSVSFLTAYDAVVGYGRLQRGEWLLVIGASSGAGVASIQTGKVIGARVIGTSGSAAKLEQLKAIGLDAGIRTRGADFAATVREVTGAGADVAVNCVGGSMFGECMRSLAFGGRLATVGYVDGVYKTELDLQELHANRHVVFGISNSRLSEAGRAATVRGFVRDVLPAIADGRVTPVIDRVFRFDELPAAKAYMESNTQVGKIVVRVA